MKNLTIALAVAFGFLVVNADAHEEEHPRSEIVNMGGFVFGSAPLSSLPIQDAKQRFGYANWDVYEQCISNYSGLAKFEVAKLRYYRDFNQLFEIEFSYNIATNTPEVVVSQELASIKDVIERDYGFKMYPNQYGGWCWAGKKYNSDTLCVYRENDAIILLARSPQRQPTITKEMRDERERKRLEESHRKYKQVLVGTNYVEREDLARARKELQAGSIDVLVSKCRQYENDRATKKKLWEQYEESQRFFKPMEMDGREFQKLKNITLGDFVFGSTNSNDALIKDRETSQFWDRKMGATVSFDCELACGTNYFIKGWPAYANAHFSCTSKRLYKIKLFSKNYNDDTVTQVIQYLTKANGGKLLLLDEEVDKRDRTNWGRGGKPEYVGLPPTSCKTLPERCRSDKQFCYRSKTNNRINVTIEVSMDELHVTLYSPDFQHLAELEDEWEKNPPRQDLEEMPEEELLTEFLKTYCNIRSSCDLILRTAESNHIARTFDIRKYACTNPPAPFVAGRKTSHLELLIPTEQCSLGVSSEIRSRWNVFPCGWISSCKECSDLNGDMYWLGYCIGVDGKPYFVDCRLNGTDHEYAKVGIYDNTERWIQDRGELIGEELVTRIKAIPTITSSVKDVLVEKCLHQLAKSHVSTNGIMNVYDYVEMVPSLKPISSNVVNEVSTNGISFAGYKLGEWFTTNDVAFANTIRTLGHGRIDFQTDAPCHSLSNVILTYSAYTHKVLSLQFTETFSQCDRRSALPRYHAVIKDLRKELSLPFRAAENGESTFANDQISANFAIVEDTERKGWFACRLTLTDVESEQEDRNLSCADKTREGRGMMRRPRLMQGTTQREALSARGLSESASSVGRRGKDIGNNAKMSLRERRAIRLRENQQVK